MSVNRTGARRRRRSPEEARREILDAAAELIARDGPDRVTLSGIAEAVGVSHALVSHYFGTVHAVAAAALHEENLRYRRRVSERVRADAGVPYADSILEVMFGALADQRYIRLWAWAHLNADHDEMTADGLDGFVDAIEEGISQALPPERRPQRSRIEAVLLLGLAAGYGYVLGGRAWETGLGHAGDDSRPAAFRAALSTALSDYLVAGR